MNILGKILAAAKEESIHEAKKTYAKGVYRASSIGGCPRALQYGALGTEAELVSPETYLLLDDGKVHHDATRRWLGKVGTVSNVEQTISKKYKKNGVSFLITGTIDGKFNGTLFDVKSISTFRFKYLNKNFPTDYQNYVWQMQIYLDILGEDKGFFIFKDKNNSALKIVWQERDDELMSKILDHISTLHRGVKEKKMIDRPYGRDTWQCKLCPFRLPCWKLPMENRTWTS